MNRGVYVFAALFHEQKQSLLSKMALVNNFKEWKFKDDPSYAKLPIDENPEYNAPVAVLNAVFSKVPTEPLSGKIHLVCSSDDALKEILDLNPEVAETDEFIQFVNGSYFPPGSQTVSHRYGGYQFGYWADQLGDGRAHILGEYVNSKGEIWQPQLKGSGETPYSRFGDGRAVLRSSIREMIASEACHYLGLPSTRAAALVVSAEHKICRDKLYTGHGRREPAAIVMRLAPAWYRLGSIEILEKRREPDLMRTLVEHIIQHHFTDIDASDDDRYVKWYSEVCHRNLDMVATWQAFGFTHGVVNTDNVSVLGLTIDYGPYGFVEHYNRHFVPNTSDDMGRYAFIRQPDIILWNLFKFSDALQPILSEEQKQKLEEVKSSLQDYVTEKILKTYLLKLGLKELHEGDDILVQEFFQIMEETRADFTATFRQLSEIDAKKLWDKSVLENYWSLDKIQQSKAWDKWVKSYQMRMEKENVADVERRDRMTKVNPIYVPRNWMLQEAIADAEENDFEKVRFLLNLFKNPYEVNDEAEKRGYSSQPPSWSYGLKLSCSS